MKNFLALILSIDMSFACVRFGGCNKEKECMDLFESVPELAIIMGKA